MKKEGQREAIVWLNSKFSKANIMKKVYQTVQRIGTLLDP